MLPVDCKAVHVPTPTSIHTRNTCIADTGTLLKDGQETFTDCVFKWQQKIRYVRNCANQVRPLSYESSPTVSGEQLPEHKERATVMILIAQHPSLH